MEIKGKVHCFFEQSGTFKNEFIKLGYQAEDYDIQNEFNQTDNNIDLFAEIEKGYEEKPSIFDNITSDDLIIAFFPCIYFTGWTNPLFFNFSSINMQKLSIKEKFDYTLERADKRNYFYKTLYKLVGVCIQRGLRLIFENPFSMLHYLHNNFIKEPSIIDKDRMQRGDYFKKPTGYWFFNCEPTYGESYQNDKKQRKIEKVHDSNKAGICSTKRSAISPDYARNFICDFILGKIQNMQQQNLFYNKQEVLNEI